MDYSKVKQAAQGYEKQMTRFLRDLIAIPSESCEEEGVIRRTIREMEALGFDKAEIDPGATPSAGWAPANGSSRLTATSTPSASATLQTGQRPL
jgi:acetylornithine deacetylase/succinyl-diaminopimelate desuccinylase-like protein